jgi:hypothetical protein
VLYPEDFYGAISSSGVPAAIIDYWEYWEAIRIYGEKQCIKTTQQFVKLIDGILLEQLNPLAATLLKKTFGFSSFMANDLFAAVVTTAGVGRWQGRNWDPASNSPAFDEYCANITNDTVLDPSLEAQRKNVQALIEIGHPFAKDKAILVNRTLNWIGYLDGTFHAGCDFNMDACVVPQNESFYANTDLGSWIWRSWTWQ